MEKLTLYNPNLMLSLRQFAKGKVGNSLDCLIFDVITHSYNTPYMLRFAIGFPEHVSLWQEWRNSDNEEEFFNKNIPANIN